MIFNKSLIIPMCMVALLIASNWFTPRKSLARQEELLFQDDFTDAASSWATQQSEGIMLECAQGDNFTYYVS